MRTHTLKLAAATVALLALPTIGRAQANTPPGPQYQADGFQRIWLGGGWRDLWAIPVTAPTLDLEQRGLEFDKRGGGRQSITVHFKEKNGSRGYVWRSANKNPMPTLAPELQNTLVSRFLQDQTGSFFPAAPLIVPPLMKAAGVLHSPPELVVITGSKELGALADTVDGMLGTFELKPNEGPDDTPGFAGSVKVSDSEKFFETLYAGHDHRLDEKDFLAARLVDMLVNDGDRTNDNYEWARFGTKESGYVWRAVSRDRDWAFVNANGLINKFIVTKAYPKFQPMGPKYRYRGLTYSTHQLDRKLLQRLTAKDFHDVATRVQAAITNPVIGEVIAKMPPEWQKTPSAHHLENLLRDRRDRLTAVAMKFYYDLAKDVDLYGSEVADRVDILRHNDGRVTVTIGPAKAPVVATVVTRDANRVVTESPGEVASTDVFYQRTFIPPETGEIRVYLSEGDDIVSVTGADNNAITVRVMGEKGKDSYTDVAGANTRFYDEDQFTLVAGAPVEDKRWNAPSPKVGLRIGLPWRPDWGSRRGFGVVAEHKTGAGLVLGAGIKAKDYGFRRLPHHWKGSANFLYGTGNGRMGVRGDLDYRFENSGVAVTADARASEIESIRFFGYGNDTPNIGSANALVDQRIVAVEPALVYHVGWRLREDNFNEIRGAEGNVAEGEDTLAPPRRMRITTGKLSIGPSLMWVDPEPRIGSPLALASATGSSSYSMAGLKLGAQFDRTDDDAMPTSGYTLRASAVGYPALMGLDDAFGTVSALATAYLPIRSGGTHFALRAGGATGMGEVPFQFAPTIGGRSSLRGYSSRRFTGDQSANASVELRVPVSDVNFFVRGKLGVFALADAGKVWMDGASPGGWHTGLGGGLWVSALGKSVSVAYAQGEAGKLYLRLGQMY